MNAPGAWTQRPMGAGAYDAGVRDGWAARVRYAPSDFVTLLWRQKWLMLAVFLVIFGLGAAYAMTLKKSYVAHSSLLVRLGQEYVYEPRAGDAGRGAVPDQDQVLQSEVEILNSDALKARVIDRIGLARIYPDLADGFATASPADKRAAMAKAIKAMTTALKTDTAPDNPIVRLTFEHPDPDMAARVLNVLLEEYLIYRKSVLLDPSAPILEEQKQSFEGKLADADRAYEDFLTSNNIGDFEAEKQALTQLQSGVQQQLYATQASLREKQARLDTTTLQMAGVAPEIGLYRDVNTAGTDKLMTLRIQREDLLSRYKLDSAPVRDLDAQIAQLESAIGAGRTLAEGAKRYGLNPIYQTLQTEKIQLTAEVAALQQQEQAYQAQVQQVTDRQLRLAQLEPRFQSLARDRDILSNNVRDYTVKAQESEAAQAMAQKGNDNIRIVQRAVPSAQGKSLKKPILVLAFLFAGFTALCLGLLRVFLTPGIQTPASASRTLDLPVLATARLKEA